MPKVFAKPSSYGTKMVTVGHWDVSKILSLSSPQEMPSRELHIKDAVVFNYLQISLVNMKARRSRRSTCCCTKPQLMGAQHNQKAWETMSMSIRIKIRSENCKLENRKYKLNFFDMTEMFVLRSSIIIHTCLELKYIYKNSLMYHGTNSGWEISRHWI